MRVVVGVTELDRVEVGVLVLVAEDDGVTVGEMVEVDDGDGVWVVEGVVLDDGVVVPVGVEEHDAYTGATEYGAAVTPRNTVLVGAVASTDFVSVTVLYEYSVVGDVRYSINAPQSSARPAMEMIIVPLSINMAAEGA